MMHSGANPQSSMQAAPTIQATLLDVNPASCLGSDAGQSHLWRYTCYKGGLSDNTLSKMFAGAHACFVSVYIGELHGPGT
jgi:hypothetical protein